MRNFAAKYWGIAVIILSAFIWLKLHDSQVRASALSDARRDSLNVAYNAIQLLNKANTKLSDSLYAQDSLIKYAKDSLKKQEAKLSQLRNKAQVLTDSVVNVLGINDEEKKLLTASIDNERNQFKAEITRVSQLNALSEEQLAVKDSIIGVRDNQIRGLNKLNKDLHDELNKPHKDSKLVKLGYIAGAFLLGKAL